MPYKRKTINKNRIEVERCWSGNNCYQFRLTTGDGRRFVIRANEDENWGKRGRQRAVGLLVAEGYDADQLRFHCRN